MAVLTPERIVDMVTERETALLSRMARMDEDLKRLRLEPFDANSIEGVEAGNDIRSFTSNDPATYLNKIMSIVSGAKLLIQEPYGMAQQEERHRYDLAERFYYGLVAAINDSLIQRVEPELQEQSGAMGATRGWIVALFLLRNHDDGTSSAECQVWDPRNVTWQLGADGLEWINYKSSRTVKQARAEYTGAQLAGKNDDDIVTVYNFFDKQHNTVTTDDETLKESLEHGSFGVPAGVVPVGALPKLWDADDIQGGDNATEKNYGESIIAANRTVYDLQNEIYSLYLELTSNQVHQTYVRNKDMDATEDEEMEESPNTSDMVISIPRDDKLAPLEHPETTKDTVLLLQSTTGMAQRGSLPYVSFGELNQNISGFAINQLNSQHQTVVVPLLKAMTTLYRLGFKLYLDQFVSGRFNPLTLRGMGNNRDYMQVTFNPDMLRNLPPPEVTFIPEMPTDDLGRMTMAQQARSAASEGGGPLLPDRFIWDEILKIPDTALLERAIKDQQSKIATPMAMEFTLSRASMEEGNEELAQLHYEELKLLMMTKRLEVMQLEAFVGQSEGGQGSSDNGNGRPAGGNNGGGPTGVDPRVLPFIMQNGEPAPSPRNAGPNRPAGAARPGARTPENQGRLRTFGNALQGLFRRN